MVQQVEQPEHPGASKNQPQSDRHRCNAADKEEPDKSWDDQLIDDVVIEARHDVPRFESDCRRVAAAQSTIVEICCLNDCGQAG
jgi:hypothetical protein